MQTVGNIKSEDDCNYKRSPKSALHIGLMYAENAAAQATFY